MEQILFLIISTLVFLITIPCLGSYMAYIFRYRKPLRIPVISKFEIFIYRLSGIHPYKEMNWTAYLKAMAWFNCVGFAFLFLIQICQYYLPLNPQELPGLGWDLAFNNAASFTTNTDWQAYGGETTLSYLTQMLGMNAQNFLSAATGNAVLLALIRGIKRTSKGLGNFWQDITRTIIYIFLPLSIILALVLISQGTIQNLHPYYQASNLEGGEQMIPGGPVASQVAIKQLGSNGGGFFNANSAHPFENPTIFSNFLETLAILLIPAATVYMYGCLLGNRKQAFVVLGVLFVLWLFGLGASLYFENSANSVMPINPVLEGKEVRFGIRNSVFWALNTTATSNGSVNAMLSSLSPLAGGFSLLNIMLGEVIFGGVGAGMIGIIMFIMLTVFLSGLMIGRTPEYMNKKIEKNEIRWVMLALMLPGALILIGSSIACVLPLALASLGNAGPHGLTEILYAYSSASGNNGSSFAGLNANTPFYNLTLGITMILGRAAILVPALAIAGLMATKKTMAKTIGTFDTDIPLFGVLLLGIILIVGGLTFFPALSLGPIIEHLLMNHGRAF